MKGIILAGGSGTRLYPLTSVVCKQLLPVYDKPMICYPLSLLMFLGIKDILIISTEKDTPLIEQYLEDGARYGLNLSYKVQTEPRGLADAFVLGADFIGDDAVNLVLGDNIFYMGDQIHDLREKLTLKGKAIMAGYHVKDPQRFGIIEYDRQTDQVLSIEEKPDKPKSNYAAIGFYSYPNDVVEKVKTLSPSPRGELEITDLNNLYLAEGRLEAFRLKRGAAWLDAGTPDSLLEAANFVGAIEHRQGLKIACLEEVAYRMGFIDHMQLRELNKSIPEKTEYHQYIKQVPNE